MSEVLSNEQIAALVEAAREGGAAQAPSDDSRNRRTKRVREIDFSRPSKFAPDQQRRLERAHEAFCRTSSTQLSAELLSSIELEVLGVEQLTWSGALHQIPQPSIAAVVHAHPLDTQVVLTAELSLVVRLIERLLGGTPSTKLRLRELTEIETALVRRIFGTLLEQLSVTWQELADVSLSLGGIEPHIANLNSLAPPSEPTLTLTIEVKIDKASSTISLLLPHRSVEPIADRLSTGQFGESAPDRAAADAVRARVAGVEVELRAEVAATTMTIDEVLMLQPGHVLRLGAPAADGVTLYAGHVPAHRAQPGRNGNHRAVQVVERLELPE
jgi:flagellar motor switch protein FliM